MFIIGRAANESETKQLETESSKYKDILHLDITENMNDGKTYHFFKQSYLKFKNEYKFVMKADDDIFLHLKNLKTKLNTLSEHGTGTVFGIPNYEEYGEKWRYLAGAAYTLSIDLVEFIATDDWVSKHINGHEDQVTYDWLNNVGKIEHFVTEKTLWSMRLYIGISHLPG